MSEDALLPLLKKLNMVFYAYSPLAGGLLAKPISQIQNPEKGSRFDTMKVFGDMYLTEGNVSALGKLQGVCDAEEITLMEATMRWFVHHSPLGPEDGVILGASSEVQLEKSLSACEKPALPEKLVKAFEELRETAKVEMPKM